MLVQVEHGDIVVGVTGRVVLGVDGEVGHLDLGAVADPDYGGLTAGEKVI